MQKLNTQVMDIRHTLFPSFTILLSFLVLFSGGCSKGDNGTRILVFTRTEGFRHASIPYGVDAIRKLGEEHNFQVNHTEDASAFQEDTLKKYDAVVFLSSSGDVFDHYQQASFKRYIQAGGGFVGIHAATTTEYGWPWFGKLVGAYFDGHPHIQQATVEVIDVNHPATDSLPTRWQRTDEWYNYRSVNPDIHVLLNLDESTYEGGEHGEDHPIAWYHEYDGGRVFYTGGGHTPESFSEPLFLDHIWGGIRYVLGEDLNNRLDYSKVRSLPVPEASRFEKVVLDAHFNEPMELEVLDENRILFIERHGNVKLHKVAEGTTRTIATLDVFSKLEDGLIGLAADPDFGDNGWIYLYYSPAGEKPEQHLSRFTMVDDSLDLTSEQHILTVPVQREECCHAGGSLEFDPDGNLYISTGDDTNPFASDGYSPLDERPGRKYWDDQRTAANTNDLRGKILRIRPQPNGAYTIPEGNLFNDDRKNTRPEIYVMGNRNPYRISIDPQTGYLYWGDVGPDANNDHERRGPRGYDEINQARKAGFFGWPYFIGDNKSYGAYDFATEKHGSFFDPASPVNNSVNNTGITELPSAQGAFIWYPYAASEEFPLTGSGGRTSMAGPVYYSDLYENHPAKFPDYYDGKLIIYEWTRNWIMAVTMDEDHNYVEMEPFMANSKFSRPVDMQFGPDGRLYVLEYGQAWNTPNPDARLSRIDFNRGNRAPVARISTDKIAGAAPFTVQFSAEGSEDYDGDRLKYTWDFGAGSGGSSEAGPAFTYEKPGTYIAELIVTDEYGAESTARVEILAGNEPPRVAIDLKGNRTFYFDGEQRAYTVQVTDKEDGSLKSGSIRPDEVAIDFRYMGEGLRNIRSGQGHQSAVVSGRRLIEINDCQACHTPDRDLTGPSYLAVAQKYEDDDEAVDLLTKKIIEGGNGTWGERAMPAHPELSQDDARQIITYILSVDEEQIEETSMPAKGTVVTQKPEDRAEKGEGYVFSAAYTDRGANGIAPLSDQHVITLREPIVSVFEADAMQIATEYTSQDNDITYARLNDGSWFRFDDIDLTGVEKLTFSLLVWNNGGSVEVRDGSLDGTLLATAQVPDDSGEYDAEAELSGLEGKHDLYIIIKSEEHPGQSLFLMNSILFENSR